MDPTQSQYISNNRNAVNAQEPTATVAILTKNAGDFFREVLHAVQSQCTQWPYEILVIDSGSSDGTVELIKNTEGIRLVEIQPAEFGHGRTRNLAMEMARGEFVAMITQDAMPADDMWLANLVEPFEKDSSVAGAFGRHLAYPNASACMKRDLALHFDHFLSWPLIMGIEDKDRYQTDRGYRQVLHFFSDNNACLRKSVWEKIPYPDVDFAEDQLWAKTVMEAGYKRAYANDAAVFHSHNYTVLDTFRRSFDESRALKKYFGYDLSSSLAYSLLQFFYCTQRDWKYLAGHVGISRSFSEFVSTPFKHMARQTGYLLGRNQGPLKNILFKAFSLDNARKFD